MRKTCDMMEEKIKANANEVKNRLTNVNATDFSDLDRGWSWVIMFASFATFCILGGFTNGIGIIHVALMKKYDDDVSITSWAGTLLVALCSLGGPLSTVVADRFSCRTVVILSGLLFTSGFLGTAFAPNIRVAIFTCGIVAGIGGGMCYTTNAVIVGMNFKRRRNLALGFSLSGIGGGLFIMSPLMQLTLNFYGPVGFFITLATISANVVTFGVMYFPSKLELHTKHMRKLEAESSNSRDASGNSLKVYWKALFIKQIVCLCISMFAYGTGLYTIYLYLPTYIEVSGFTSIQASFLLSFSGVISVIARLMTGALASIKYVDEIWFYSGSMFIVALATSVYPFISNGFVGQIVFTSLLGLSSGSCYIMMTPVSIRFVGINFVSASLGIQLFFCGLGSIVGPVCAGIIVDNGGTYKQCFIIAAASIFAAAICSASTIACSSKSVDNYYIDKTGSTEAVEFLNENDRETNSY